MPLEVRLSASANADLQDIAGWITEQAGEDVALAYINRVEETCRRLIDMPNGGAPRPKLGRGYCSVVFERKLRVFYRVEGRTIVIKRILHGSRDLKRVFRGRHGS